MTHSHNVGHVDALARRIVASFAVLCGLASIEYVFFAMPFITWLFLSVAFVTGLFFLIGGLRGGTAVFGLVLMALAVCDGWLAVLHYGQWALVLSGIVAVDGFLTAHYGWSPINAVMHKDTHTTDAEWALGH
ncbi:MAG TPA: hypothetical protein VLV45_12455 [Gemmatimonadales bacterium]|nr:hypothetical protein [Gemmatimonadales bacterium]